MSLRPPPARRSLSRPIDLSWAPIVVLALVLAVILVVALWDAVASPHFVRSRAADDGLFRVGGLPGNSGPQDPAGSPTPTTVLLTSLQLIAATSLGALVVRVLRGSDRWPRPVSVLAGFLPGYLMLLGPLQLVFSTLPLSIAVWLAVVAVPLAAAAVHLPGLVAHRPHMRLARGLGPTAAGVLGVIVIAGVHRLQAGRYFLFQDSIYWFLIARKDQALHGFGDHLVQWNQQSDEWLFNASAMFHDLHANDFVFPLYATQLTALASFCCLTWGLIHVFARRRRALAASVGTAAILAATPSVYPWAYTLVVGGDNPILWTGHPGRLIGVLVPWSILALVSRPRSRQTTVALALCLIGLCFTSINSVALVVVTMACALVWQRGTRHVVAPRSTLATAALVAARAGPPATIGLIVFTFWYINVVTPADASAWLLVLAAVIALVAAAGVIALTGDGEPRRSLATRTIAFTIAVMSAGLVLANNLVGSAFDGRLRRALASVMPGYDGPLLARPDLPANLLDGLHFPRLSPAACDVFVVQCSSFGGFLADLGFVFVLAAGAYAALGPLTGDPVTNTRRCTFLVLLGVLALGLTAVRFSGATDFNQANILSRFLEQPVYGMFGLSAIVFAEARSRAVVMTGIGLLATWTIVPLVVAQWPEQMARNVGWIADHVGLT